jgi:hypothetical protein
MSADDELDTSNPYQRLGYCESIIEQAIRGVITVAQLADLYSAYEKRVRAGFGRAS